MLATDGTPGLQVQRWDGRWEDAAHIPYALVINNGQVMYVSVPSIPSILLLFPSTNHSSPPINNNPFPLPQRTPLRLPLPRHNPSRPPSSLPAPLNPLLLLPPAH